MPNAFTNGRATLDPKPYAPGTGGLTPLQLATANRLVGKWISTGQPNKPGLPAYAPGYYRRSKTMPAHDYTPNGPICAGCPLPPVHPIHTVPELPADVIDLTARITGEREEPAA